MKTIEQKKVNNDYIASSWEDDLLLDKYGQIKILNQDISKLRWSKEYLEKMDDDLDENLVNFSCTGNTSCN